MTFAVPSWWPLGAEATVTAITEAANHALISCGVGSDPAESSDTARQGLGADRAAALLHPKGIDQASTAILT